MSAGVFYFEPPCMSALLENRKLASRRLLLLINYEIVASVIDSRQLNILGPANISVVARGGGQEEQCTQNSLLENVLHVGKFWFKNTTFGAENALFPGI